MKFRNLAAGFAVGVAGGTLIAVLNAPKSGAELQSSLKSGSGNMKTQMNQLKMEANEVKSSFLQTKRESQEVFETLGDEVKTMISNFQADINPNIEHIKKDVPFVDLRPALEGQPQDMFFRTDVHMNAQGAAASAGAIARAALPLLGGAKGGAVIR